MLERWDLQVPVVRGERMENRVHLENLVHRVMQVRRGQQEA